MRPSKRPEQMVMRAGRAPTNDENIAREQGRRGGKGHHCG